MPPETKYARSPNGAIAYQVFGEGPIDLVFVTQWGTNVDSYWDEPSAARYLDRLAKGVASAREILSEVRGLGIEMRAGLHTGEITFRQDDIGGIGVHIASRVMGHAPDGAVAASGTVRDLTFGSSIHYESLGSFDLKGVPGEWELFRIC